MKTSKTLSAVVVAEHRRLTAGLDELIGVTIQLHEFTHLSALLHRMSACHYSEEITAYDKAHGIVLAEGDSFKAFHAMLDNMHESIKLGGPMSDALGHELMVLRVLTNIHFCDEERIILPEVEKQIGPAKSSELAGHYLSSMDELCRQTPPPQSGYAADSAGSRSEPGRATNTTKK